MLLYLAPACFCIAPCYPPSPLNTLQKKPIYCIPNDSDISMAGHLHKGTTALFVDQGSPTACPPRVVVNFAKRTHLPKLHATSYPLEHTTTHTVSPFLPILPVFLVNLDLSLPEAGHLPMMDNQMDYTYFLCSEGSYLPAFPCRFPPPTTEWFKTFPPATTRFWFPLKVHTCLFIFCMRHEEYIFFIPTSG